MINYTDPAEREKLTRVIVITKKEFCQVYKKPKKAY